MNADTDFVKDQDSKPLLLTVPEAASRLRVSRWMLYRLIQQRQLMTITIGTRRLIPMVDLEAYIDRQREAP